MVFAQCTIARFAIIVLGRTYNNTLSSVLTMDRIGGVMELGNMISGNSRGNYPIGRGVGYEEQLERLFEAYAPERDNSWREYGERFENDAFEVFPYYWGEDCTCGFDELDIAWEDAHPHKPECYQTVLRKRKVELEASIGYKHPQLKAVWSLDGEPEPELCKPKRVLKLPENTFSEWERLRALEDELYDELCEEYGVDREYGAAIHCTCGVHEEYGKWRETHNHDPECWLVKPNFLYKPTGFSISWYKYPLRDSYMSEQLTVAQFTEIIDKCIESLEA